MTTIVLAYAVARGALKALFGRARAPLYANGQLVALLYGDGRLETRALQRAINRGGLVQVPVGTFSVGQLVMGSGDALVGSGKSAFDTVLKVRP